jgi:hypothetical protein
MLHRLIQPFGEGGAGILTTLLVGVCIAGALFYSWSKWGPLVAQNSRYWVTAESIDLNNLPDWISPETQIKKEVFSSGLLEEVSTLDPHAATRIAQAFELNPWVKNVERVTKSAPNRVRIELEYRQPIAVVWIQLTANSGGWEPVDSEGVVLPEDRFHQEPERLSNYLRIVSQPPPQVPNDVGITWPDDRVQHGATLATMLARLWREWGIDNIYVARSVVDASPVFSLRAGQNVKIIWGHGPGLEQSGELKAAQKLLLISEYLKQHGAISSWPASQILDVQHPGGMRVTSRPSNRDLDR